MSRFTLCVVPGCTRVRQNHGEPHGQGIYCAEHYQRLITWGAWGEAGDDE